MPNKSGKMFIFEAIELRKEYDKHIELLMELLHKKIVDYHGTFAVRYYNLSNTNYEHSIETNKIKDELENIKKKRIKLNEELQISNVNAKIEFEGKKISLANALELRKVWNGELVYLKSSLFKAAFKKTIYKENRDVVRKTEGSFDNIYIKYIELRKKRKALLNAIHISNHKKTVNLTEE